MEWQGTFQSLGSPLGYPPSPGSPSVTARWSSLLPTLPVLVIHLARTLDTQSISCSLLCWSILFSLKLFLNTLAPAPTLFTRADLSSSLLLKGPHLELCKAGAIGGHPYLAVPGFSRTMSSAVLSVCGSGVTHQPRRCQV